MIGEIGIKVVIASSNGFLDLSHTPNIVIVVMDKWVKYEHMEEKHDVIIVGGGPVGLFCGLTLAQKGVDVLVLEAEADIVQSPRALM